MVKPLMLSPLADSRVLVVDDQPANTRLVSQLLRRAGLVHLMEVNDSRQVGVILSDFDPDLVLLDLKMPNLDGFDILALIQEYAAGAYLPVIVITADDSRMSVEKALSSGAQDYVRKPFEGIELTLRVRNVLATRAAVVELRRSRSLLRERLDVFEPELSGIVADTTREQIASVITNNEVRIATQPVVDMRDASVVGAEALSRFPTDSLRTPAAWFTSAARLGMSVDLERYTLALALAQLAQMPDDQFLAVNVSPGMVLAGLPHGHDWSRVVLELTEHSPVEDYPALNRTLAPLRAQGVRLAVDDTGAGFASLRHILDLQPDIIKLDIAIIRDIDRDPRRAAIAGMMTQFADDQQTQVIAEGVETEAERDTLLELGAKWGQGYLFGRPAIME
jgi:EAL domain-containing protein (putative c-di-GMP-specific phosphodiesterase class I)/AmiR/NasT family two-component response regulator